MQSQIIFLVVLVAFAVADHSGEKNRVCTPACVDGQVCGHDNKCFTLPKCEPACVEPQKCGWQSQCFTPVECSPACAQGQFCNPMNGTCMAPPAGGWGAHHGVAQAPTA